MRLPRSIALVDPLATGHHPGYAALLAQELVRLGYQVQVIGPDELVQHVCTAVPQAAGHVLRLFPTTPPAYYRLGRLAREQVNVRFFRRALRIARAQGCDTVHMLYLDSFVLPLLLTWLVGAGGMRLRTTLHWTYFLRSFRERGGAPSEAVHLLLLRLLGLLGGRIMLHSAAQTELLRAKLNLPVVDAVPYPAEPPQVPPEQRAQERQAWRERLGLAPGVPVLLAFGGTRHDKGIDLAIRALALLPKHHLLVVGSAWSFDGEQLERLAGELGVRGRLHLRLEHVPDEEVEGHFLASDITLLPYRRKFAGQSGPLVIAAALGLPVLASDVGVLAETVRAYRLGALFPPEDPAALARAVANFDPAAFAPDTAGFRRDHAPTAFARAVLASYLRGRTAPLPQAAEQ